MFIQETEKKGTNGEMYTFELHNFQERSPRSNRSNRNKNELRTLSVFMIENLSGWKEKRKICGRELCHAQDQYFAIDIVLLIIIM